MIPALKIVSVGAILTSLAVAPVNALTASSAVKASATGATASSATTTTQTARLALIIQRGNTEITRRLTSLATLNAKISSAEKLSSDDKASLTSQVTTEINGLTTLKTTLDADTVLATAQSDAQSIITDYRVYAVVLPKVYLVKTADDQQVAETSLTTMATAVQARLTADQQAGKNVTSLQATLTDLQAKTAAAQTLSSAVESGAINVQPTDYDSNHSVLSGDRDQLVTASSDLKTALSDAKSLVSGLKALE